MPRAYTGNPVLVALHAHRVPAIHPTQHMYQLQQELGECAAGFRAVIELAETKARGLNSTIAAFEGQVETARRMPGYAYSRTFLITAETAILELRAKGPKNQQPTALEWITLRDMTRKLRADTTDTPVGSTADADLKALTLHLTTRIRPESTS